MGEVDFPGILVLELFQAATRAAVAQAFPFGVGHLFQRLGFPEESLLGGSWLGWRGHRPLFFPESLVSQALLGAMAAPLQAPRVRAAHGSCGIRPIVQNRSNTIGLWPPLG